MSFTKESAAEAAKADLASRLGKGNGDISVVSVDDTEFPDMSLGAATSGELS